ncbi:MAG: lipocalin family protein, partial [Calditrichia bacterium]
MIALLLSFAFSFHGCEGRKSEKTAKTKKGKKELIVGVWTRPIRGWKTGQTEGMNIKADGTFSLMGIYTMKGLNWQIRGDTLRLTTNTGRYPEPFESLFRIRE